ncbi:MAG TPA: type II toxin-antitoxin system RelE/ParE family toxin [Pyrinomonadaceae bacterium]|jgi:mRNA interferase RelE/StbE
MPYRIVLTKSAAKELDGLSPKIHDKIVVHLRQLEQNPRTFGAEKLTALNAYKLRVGNYRIVYEINDSEKEVRIVLVEDRKQVYQRLRRKK